jgi:hypothetical protein
VSEDYLGLLAEIVAFYEEATRQQDKVLSPMYLRSHVRIEREFQLSILEALDQLRARINRADANGQMRVIYGYLRSFAADTGLIDEMQDSGYLPTASLSGGGTGRHMPVNASAQILLLVLMWLIVMTVPVAIQKSDLPAETQQTLNDYYGLIAGLAVTITFLIAPKLLKKTTRK